MTGFVRLHVLHHANTAPIFGIGIIEKLAFHGYMLSPAPCIQFSTDWKEMASCAPVAKSSETEGAASTKSRTPVNEY